MVDGRDHIPVSGLGIKSWAFEGIITGITTGTDIRQPNYLASTLVHSQVLLHLEASWKLLSIHV